MEKSTKQESTEKISGILRSNTASQSQVQSMPLSMQPSLQVGVTSLQSSVERSVTFVITEDEGNQRESCSNQARKEERNAIDVKNCTDMQRVSIAEEEANEDEYSASACEIMQRRSSSRRQSRRRRRPSSPFNAEAEAMLRRRSSVYTISSGETVISIEESGSQEQIFEKLKMHKEVLSGVKQQAWPLCRKIKLVRQAKSYVRRHEGVLQERLAHTRSTKDVIARISLFITKKWQYCRREMVNLQTWLVPWELRIKEIESHFGSAVASYFTFLRWLFWINLVMTVILTAFVAIPEMLIADRAAAGERKIMLEEEKIKSKHLLTLWEFEGILRYSPFFYGWYTNQDSESGYRLPLAYFVTNLVIYIYSFVAILRKMAKNSRLSKLTEKDDECVFSWKLFTGWDFMIGNTETAHNRTASIVLGFKEALLEEAEKEKDERNWRIISMRIFVNTSVIALFGLSAYAVVKMVVRSSEELEQTNWWRQNEITVVLSLITYVFPSLFEILGLLESYHPRKQLRLQLARIMVLNLLNFYSLIFALFEKIHSMKQDLEYVQETIKNCKYISIECDDSMKKSQQVVTLASLSLILANNVTAMQYRSELPETTSSPNPLDIKARKKPRRLCWETMFGQELAKLTVMDLILSIVTTLSIDFFRAVFVRYMNNCWCWDLEKQFPQYGDFKIAENILHLVNNQGIIWMGMFFSPGLTALNLLKLGILMYLRSWAVLTCNVPHEVVFRASRSNNFYYALLLTMLCLYILPVGYAIVWVKPSWDCGPFSGYEKIYQLATKQLNDSLPDPINKCLDYIASPGIIIPLIVLMVLIIYYMVSLTNSLREANNDLKIQLRHERTEERRKLFKIVKKREELSDSSFLKWKRMLPALTKRSAKTRTAKVIDKPEVAGMVFDERKRSASEVVELTDMEQDAISHDQTQHTISESSYNEKGTINTRLTKVFHGSWESQSSDCAVIPEIRINKVEGKSECHS
ncbi:transmembrane channel-like protein isoform X5 [Bombus terrestris]|uniref:Transmembrane channel-like protein isoform X5 n=1 Tax=Bombus terrestris TaxID=30195 RepID=A0A9C6SNA1_BOMTE|nr:transmembrane channel-like protein isoform X5 [Bombus terrestris]